MSHSGPAPVQASGAAPLKQAGLRLPDVVAQSVGFIGPVFSSALVLPLIVGAGLYGAGVATPVAVILAAIGMAAIGWIIAEYAKRIHAPGALFDYVSDGFGVIKGGTRGNSVTPVKPSSSADGWKGIFFGIIYAILVFTGFETAANLGEETRAPARTIPRAIIMSVVVVGAFYLLAAYAQDIGFGLNAKNWASSPAPLFQLAAPGAFGSSWFLDVVQILVILDIAAVGLGCAVSTVRGVYAMARDGRSRRA
jgi:amino acid transporter